jgi:hypothetical protein
MRSNRLYPSEIRIDAIVAEAPPDAEIAVNRCGTPTTNIAGRKMYLPNVRCILRVQTRAIEEAAL